MNWPYFTLVGFEDGDVFKLVDEDGRPLTEDGSLGTWHDFFLNQIECVIKHGLPAVYGEDIFSFMCDIFGGDLPWEPAEHEAVTKAIEESPRLESLRAAFQERFGIDFWENPDEG
jgi:hypothetical protein